MMFRAIRAGLLLATVSTGSANAALIVSADSNIVTPLNDNYTPHYTGNQRFFRNILNGSTNVVIRDSLLASSIDASFLTGYYSSIGVGTTVVGTATGITAADLGGTGLYIDILPRRAYASGEIAAISAFLGSGGNFLVTGDNNIATAGVAANGYINSLLTAIGSGIQIRGACVACGFFDVAGTVGSNPLVAGVPGVQIAASSYLTGGAALFSYYGDEIVAAEGSIRAVPGVPEPASWALMIGGLGLVGTSLRRRRGVVA